ncbi:hypothetical protein OIU77_021487 [Salix suchowensis]|uniref:Uncharacterized protein n=1 Tax=Salix suchowensis TaxID=1278906 RepID=A0ABQ9CDE6_9ROSI|nr:hypothetical protein OIU77_021487 [Salix suchowensis]
MSVSQYNTTNPVTKPEEGSSVSNARHVVICKTTTAVGNEKGVSLVATPYDRWLSFQAVEVGTTVSPPDGLRLGLLEESWKSKARLQRLDGGSFANHQNE